MRILLLSWEYPPRSIGGLARHVEDLAQALARVGQEVHVLTCAGHGAPLDREEDGVYVHRAEPYQVNAYDFFSWALQLNVALLEKAISVFHRCGKFDLIHAHDWLAAYVGRALKHAYNLPLVATIHATEAGRNGGLFTTQQWFVNSVEWWLSFESWRVIVCSRHMVEEVQRQFQLPTDKIHLIPNGVNAARFQSVNNDPRFRQFYAHPGEKIVLFVGRLVREKGVQVLLEAAPEILSQCPEAKFIIAGTGPMESELRYLAAQKGLGGKVFFTGYVDDSTRNRLYKEAAVAVFPSLYEPFGIVALEGWAAGAPLVVSESGGLREIVQHGINGLKAWPGDARSLAVSLIAMLKDEELASRLRQAGAELAEKFYNWPKLARATVDVYREVRREFLEQQRRGGVMLQLLRGYRGSGEWKTAFTGQPSGSPPGLPEGVPGMAYQEIENRSSFMESRFRSLEHYHENRGS